MEHEYLTVPQLAELLGISRIAVYKKVKSGHIPSTRFGRNFAISKDYVHQNLVEIQKTLLADKDVIQIDSIMHKMMDEYDEVMTAITKL